MENGFRHDVGGLESAWCVSAETREVRALLPGDKPKSSRGSPRGLTDTLVLYSNRSHLCYCVIDRKPTIFWWLQLLVEDAIRWGCNSWGLWPLPRSLEGILFTNCIGRDQRVRCQEVMVGFEFDKWVFWVLGDPRWVWCFFKGKIPRNPTLG